MLFIVDICRQDIGSNGMDNTSSGCDVYIWFSNSFNIYIWKVSWKVMFLQGS